MHGGPNVVLRQPLTFDARLLIYGTDADKAMWSAYVRNGEAYECEICTTLHNLKLNWGFRLGSEIRWQTTFFNDELAPMHINGIAFLFKK